MLRTVLPSLLVCNLFLPSCADSPGGGDPGGSEPDPNRPIWTTDDSPKQLDEDFTIDAETTLTVEAGVTVELAEGVSLIVEGALVARGSEAEPIVFTGDVEHRWGSVLFAEGAHDAVYEDLDEWRDGSILEHVVFEHARKAVQLLGASPFIHACTFKNNQSEAVIEPGGGPAIYMEAGAAPRIQGCLFEDNEAEPFAYGGAVYAKESDPILQDNVFRRNVSTYGGAVTTDISAGPVVGNVFEDNEALTKGGGIAVISTASALLNNTFTGNRSVGDGGGIHVCVDCYPHATPFILDNTVTGNHAESSGAGGIGAAFLRRIAYNNVYDNTLGGGGPSDFGWFHSFEEGYPDYFANPTIAHNWWGTTDVAAIQRAIFDGTDDAGLGAVTFDPILTEAVGGPSARVTITTRKIKYIDSGDPMPVFLTLYNPSAARDVDLIILLQYGEGPVVPYHGELDFPGATHSRGRHRLSMPDNGVYFTTLLDQGELGAVDTPEHGYWHAAIFDADSGEPLDAVTIRFELGDSMASGGPALVPGVGVTVGGERLEVGQARADVEAAHGAPALTRDLGEVGVYFDYPALGLSGVFTGTAPADTVRVISLDREFDGSIDHGVSLGATKETAEGGLGPASLEPFTRSDWFRDDGVVYEYGAGVVVRAHLF